MQYACCIFYIKCAVYNILSYYPTTYCFEFHFSIILLILYTYMYAIEIHVYPF